MQDAKQTRCRVALEIQLHDNDLIEASIFVGDDTLPAESIRTYESEAYVHWAKRIASATSAAAFGLRDGHRFQQGPLTDVIRDRTRQQASEENDND